MKVLGRLGKGFIEGQPGRPCVATTILGLFGIIFCVFHSIGQGIRINVEENRSTLSLGFSEGILGRF